jgi:hypothetical protein
MPLLSERRRSFEASEILQARPQQVGTGTRAKQFVDHEVYPDHML